MFTVPFLQLFSRAQFHLEGSMMSQLDVVPAVWVKEGGQHVGAVQTPAGAGRVHCTVQVLATTAVNVQVLATAAGNVQVLAAGRSRPDTHGDVHCTGVCTGTGRATWAGYVLHCLSSGCSSMYLQAVQCTLSP